MHDELTVVDIKKMREEIEYRKTVLTPKLKESLRYARELGDLSENFEYRAAKRDLSRNNSRIHYLEQMINTAVIVSAGSNDADTIGLFDKVRLYIEEDDEEMEIVIVTTLRQDSINNFISKESPLGKAVMGKRVGDRVLIEVNPSYSYYVVVRSVERGHDDESLNISAF